MTGPRETAILTPRRRNSINEGLPPVPSRPPSRTGTLSQEAVGRYLAHSDSSAGACSRPSTPADRQRTPNRAQFGLGRAPPADRIAARQRRGGVERPPRAGTDTAMTIRSTPRMASRASMASPPSVARPDARHRTFRRYPRIAPLVLVPGTDPPEYPNVLVPAMPRRGDDSWWHACRVSRQRKPSAERSRQPCDEQALKDAMRLTAVPWSSASRRSASDVEMEFRGDGPGGPNRLDQGSRQASRPFDRPQDGTAGGGDPVAYRCGIPRDDVDRFHPQCSTPSSLRGEPAVSQRTILPPPAPSPGSVLHLCTMIRSRPGCRGRRGCPGGSFARCRTAVTLDGDCGPRAVRSGGRSRLARPAMSRRGPLAGGLLLPMLARGGR